MIYGGLDKHHPFYMAWCNMKTRCNNPKSTQYQWYGGRGITYCESWEKFESFYIDLFEFWTPGLTLDRKDNNSNYCKSNCRWVTQQEQNLNRRARRNNIYCKRGHELTPDNSVMYPNGSRTCKICRQAYYSTAEVRDTRNSNKRVSRMLKKLISLDNNNGNIKEES